VTQTHFLSESLVVPRIESLHLQPGTLTTRPQRRSYTYIYIYVCIGTIASKIEGEKLCRFHIRTRLPMWRLVTLLHRSPEGRKSRRKGNPPPEGHKYKAHASGTVGWTQAEGLAL
jgi:hypothetical protein